MAKHRLVALGDSMTQGFMSGAIFATDLSYPALIAREMGLDLSDFRVPSFSAHGGLPVNLERLLRLLEKEYGPDLSAWDALGAPFSIRTWMGEIEDFWERGPGTMPRAADPYHNLAIWGYTVDDVVHLKASDCAARCRTPNSDDFFNQIPENAFYRTALAVLNPSQDPALMQRTALDCARALAADGGIENLIVNLGANNALGTITALGDPLLTGNDILVDPVRNREKYNLWRPEHFDHFYAELVKGIESLNAERVFVANIPHVTIAPIARGVGTSKKDRLESDPKYFKFYTRFWITDDRFDPAKHKHISGEQAKMIDENINRYNRTIQKAVDAHANWRLIDVNNKLSRMAFRRFREIGEEVPGGKYVFPPGWDDALNANGHPELTTHYFMMKDNRRERGGIFSLDGVHPTTMGYGLLAHEFIKVMREAKVEFRAATTGQPLPDPIEIDFARLLRRDTLVNSPPKTLDDVIGVAEWLDGWIHLGWILNTIHGTTGTSS
jgi:lysophospholipase L1-like esterase